jgi:hypothetical protein
MGFCLVTASRPDLGPHPASHPMSNRALSPKVNRPGSEDDHSPPLMPRLRMHGAIPPPTPAIYFHDVVLS